MKENFIPWEQIEPLVASGMTFRELGRAVTSALGLPPDAYKLRGVGPGSTHESIRFGVLVLKRGTAGGRPAGDDVIA